MHWCRTRRDPRRARSEPSNAIRGVADCDWQIPRPELPRRGANARIGFALADAPKTDNRPIRLIRRVGAGAFEFVHDQMYAYLAARWFAQDGFSTAELEKMIAGSTIWKQTPDARRILWGFAAALLDDKRLVELWVRIEEGEEWDVLRRALKSEAERRGLPAPRKPEVEKRAGH